VEDQDELFFELKCDGDSIKITPIKFIIYNSEYSWDKNWIKTQIDIKAGVFTGTYLGEFMTHDFVNFKKELQNLYINLNSSAKFEGLEGYLKIDIKGDGVGHLNAVCVANDHPGYGNELTSHFYFDQTYIPHLVKQLDKINEYFPVTK
jgi:hypothetical protein